VAHADDGPFTLPIAPDPSGACKWVEQQKCSSERLQIARGAALVDPFRYDSVSDRPVSPTRRAILPATMLRLASSGTLRWSLPAKAAACCAFPNATPSSRDIAIVALPTKESLVVLQRPAQNSLALSAPTVALPLPSGVVPLSLALLPSAHVSPRPATRLAVGTLWTGVVLMSLHASDGNQMVLTADAALTTTGHVPGCYFPVNYVSVCSAIDDKDTGVPVMVRAASHYSQRIICWATPDWAAPCWTTPAGSPVAGLVSGPAPLAATVAGRLLEAETAPRYGAVLPHVVTQLTATSKLPPWRTTAGLQGLGEAVAVATCDRRLVFMERFQRTGRWRAVADVSLEGEAPCLGLAWLDSTSKKTMHLAALLGNSEVVVVALNLCS
jgi:hypothetical protein